MANKNLLALAAGLGAGYMNAGRQAKADKAAEEDRAMRKATFDAQQEELARQKAERLSLADAARPVAVEAGAGGQLRPPTMDNRDVGLPENQGMPNGGLADAAYRVGTQSFVDQGSANDAAAAANKPEAVNQRMAQAYRASGSPEKAMTLENATLQQQGARVGLEASQLNLEEAKRQKFKRIKEEGIIDAARALAMGDAQGMVAAFNAGGQYKIVSQPEMVTEEREIPGIGKRPTQTAKFKAQMPDGIVKDVTVNSHDLNMQLLPYAEQYKMDMLAKANDNKAEYQALMLDAKSKQIEQQANAAALRMELAIERAKAANSKAAPIWSDKADALLNKAYFSKDENGGQLIDAGGAKFAKAIALGVAASNGGDSHTGVMTALEVDQRLKDAATKQASAAKDPAERARVYASTLNALRGEYLARITGAKPAAPAQPQTPQGRAISVAPPGSVSLQPNGTYAPGAAQPAPARAMPQSLADLPGAVDNSTRVARGTDLLN